MDDLALIVDLHKDGARQGPGGDAETALAVTLSGLRGASDLRIADIGCGTGASTLVLARELDAHITAIDMVPDFLETLQATAERAGLADRIETRAATMEALPFADASLDAIWSEGAIYSMGFAAGVAAWRRFLKPGGILAVSEITWFTDDRPDEIERHWTAGYPEIDTASEKMAVLEAMGFAPIGYFTLPERCWRDAYYRPMEARFDAFLARHRHSPEARAVVEAERAEIALYEGYAAYYGYGYYIARKVTD
jgi:SAM-dependent methyltransferase